MGSKKSKLIQDFGQNLTDHHQSKRKNKEISYESPFMTKITDINIDCLERIFKYLDIKDLLNVADSTKCFKQAVDLTYSSKYGRCTIELEPTNKRSLPKVQDDVIEIFKLSTCLQMLRCFGHLIRKIKISFYRINCRHNNGVVDQYLSEYCADYLESIELRYTQLYTMENNEKPFSKVKHMNFLRNCELGDNLTDFNKLFPNLRSLEFTDRNFITDRKCIGKYIPHLNHLTIQIFKSDEYTFKPSHVAEALRLNPQIQVLQIAGDIIDVKFLHSIREYLQSIEEFNIGCPPKCFNYDDNIHLQNVKNLKILISNGPGKKDVDVVPMPRIPFSFDRLEKLELALYACHLTDDAMNFISTQPFLTTLYIWSKTSLKNEEDKLKLARAVCSLKEVLLILKVDKFTIDEILDFVRICESLKEICFPVENVSVAADQLPKNLGNEWRIGECLELNLIKLER